MEKKLLFSVFAYFFDAFKKYTHRVNKNTLFTEGNNAKLTHLNIWVTKIHNSFTSWEQQRNIKMSILVHILEETNDSLLFTSTVYGHN